MPNKDAEDTIGNKCHHAAPVYERSNLKDPVILNNRHKPFCKEQLDNSKTDEKHPHENDHCPKYFLIHIYLCFWVLDQRP